MPDVFGAIFGRCSRQSVITDSVFFRLNYRITVILLVASALAVIVQEIFHDPMECIFADYPEIGSSSYCSFQSVFSLKRKVIVTEQVSDVEGSAAPDDMRTRTYTHYQLGFITLLLQAVLFCIPRCLWNLMEGGKMKLMATELITSTEGKACREKDIQPLTLYFHDNLHKHNNYAMYYMVCEVLNLFNLGVQLQLMAICTGKPFDLSNVFAMFTGQLAGVTDISGKPLSITTECTYAGPFDGSGNPGNITGICQLARNSYNEQIQVFLWLWMYLLNVFGIFTILYHFATYLSSSLRWLQFRLPFCTIPEKSQAVVYDRLEIEDWFVLMMLRKNIHREPYEELVSQLAVIYRLHVQDSAKFIPE
ncbi:viral innexin-b10.1 [Ichnoviriform fugitivi]|uniref:Viral innexin-b10.1 n=1 Tax=Ichnoviriform fugitivi TaxID=265522 RepID=A2Q0E2_9VIRU|nr:viral innexin-b10.1 [Ichnoviriform fugitivi]BAF45657.1 viral innexin-b10.1 [Ichnoviriform fugitivi]